MIADAVEPFGIDIRQAARHYNSSTPLNRLVDAARPGKRAESAGWSRWPEPMRTWSHCGRRSCAWSKQKEFAPDDFLLAEVAPVGDDLAAIGAIGLQVLDQMESGKTVPENWISEQKQLLDKLEAPKAEVRLVAVRPVRVLLEEISRRSGVTGAGSASACKSLMR